MVELTILNPSIKLTTFGDTPIQQAQDLTFQMSDINQYNGVQCASQIDTN